MQIQLSFTSPYSKVKTDKPKKEKNFNEKNNSKNNSQFEKIKTHKFKKSDRKGDYEKLNDDAFDGNYSLL